MQHATRPPNGDLHWKTPSGTVGPMKIIAATATALALLGTASVASAQDFPVIPSAAVVAKATATLGVTHRDLIVPNGCTKKFAPLSAYAKRIGVKNIIVFSCPVADDVELSATLWPVSHASRAL